MKNTNNKKIKENIKITYSIKIGKSISKETIIEKKEK